MPNELISVIDIARIHGKRKQSIFKLLKRLGLEQVKGPGEGTHGQAVSYISQPDYELLQSELSSIKTDPGGSVEVESTPGVFYLIQLEPEHDPGRFKIGFASNIDERLRSHRTAAPLCQLVKTLPCKPLWEKTAIDSVCAGYERLYTEVFRALSLEEVESRCNRFFSRHARSFHLVIERPPPNQSLQPTANPLRGSSAAELGHYV